MEHFYHGEISFVPPFLTAMKTPSEIPTLLREMATIVTAAWGIGMLVSRFIKRHFSGVKGNPLGTTAV